MQFNHRFSSQAFSVSASARRFRVMGSAVHKFAVAIGLIVAAAAVASPAQAEPVDADKATPTAQPQTAPTGSRLKRAPRQDEAVTMDAIELIGAVDDPQESEWPEVTATPSAAELPVGNEHSFLRTREINPAESDKR